MPRPRTLANLRSALDAKHVLRLKVRGNLRESPFGIPVALSEELVVLHTLRDFEPDGYCAVPLSRIRAAKSREYEQAYDRVCEKLRIVDQVHPPAVESDSLLPLCNTLRRAGKFVIIEALDSPEDAEAEEEANVFFIGKLTGLSDSALALHNFDATGAWDAAPTSLRLSQVLSIQWDTRYLGAWQRYLT